MLARLLRPFTPGPPTMSLRLGALILSDYLAFYDATPVRERWGVSGSTRRESPRRLALLFLPRLITNPCLHAVVMIRCALASPSFTLGLWRTALIHKHSIDLSPCRIGAGLVLPHPMGIVLGWGLEIGSNVTILHNVTIGGMPHRQFAGRISPTIEDDVVIYMYSTVLGPVTVGARSVIGAGGWIEGDVPADSLQRGTGALVARSRVAEADAAVQDDGVAG